MSEDGNNHAGGSVGGGTRTRAAMAFLAKRLASSERIHESELEATLTFASTVRDTPTASVRDRIRAAELLAMLMERGIDVADKLDKMERLESGHDTERVGGRIEVGTKIKVEMDMAG
jgi:hypothetical protein